MSDIFREIDEELRRDNLAKLWDKYSHFVIGLAVLVVAAVAAVEGWSWYKARERREESVRYTAALDLARRGENAQAADAFALLGRQASSGYRVLARLEEADSRAKAGDAGAALAAYEGLADDRSVDPVYRDLGTLLWAQHSLGKEDPNAVVSRLAPLTADGNAWRPLALETTALAKLRAGDRPAALDIYKRLADDLTAPQGLRARASEMVSALGEAPASASAAPASAAAAPAATAAAPAPAADAAAAASDAASNKDK